MTAMKKILIPLIASLFFPLLAPAESACPSQVITGHPHTRLLHGRHMETLLALDLNWLRRLPSN
ncbi:MAG: hypothetical protein Q8K35_07640 [Thiobacillus sp.]|nr:hypothetical protein [Thiobacillus sp.]MDP2057610.1 hypothetical protein [Thiobacillus sp.]